MHRITEHSALALLCPIELAREIIRLHEENNLKNEECLALVGIELPLTSLAAVVKDACSVIPLACYEDSLEHALQSQGLAYVCGAGVNPAMMRWISAHLPAFARGDVMLLSIVERSALRHGYPNLDFVAAVGHGHRENNEDLLYCALRET
jgi:hypothetical protein